MFGWGTNADQAFWVKITVGSPTSTVFAVTSIDSSIDDNNVIGTCPHTFKWTANIKVNKAGTITFHWDRSDGSSTSTDTLTFSAAGTKSVTDTWKITATGNGWERIYIDDPNHQAFPKVNFKMTCS
jgi:hypothetical protein